MVVSLHKENLTDCEAITNTIVDKSRSDAECVGYTKVLHTGTAFSWFFTGQMSGEEFQNQRLKQSCLGLTSALI